MVGAQGQVKWAKVAKKFSTYDVTHKKSASPNQNFFRVQTGGLATSFDVSTRSVALTEREEFPAKPRAFWCFFENPQKRPDV